jgi:hypothetical protein
VAFVPEIRAFILTVRFARAEYTVKLRSFVGRHASFSGAEVNRATIPYAARFANLYCS